MSETKLVHHIQGQLSNGDVRLFRNNVGRLKTKDGRWVQYGLCPGSSDLIGWKMVTIPKEWVGEKIPIFVAIECKSEHGRLTTEQNNFLNLVMDCGGIAGMVRTLEEARQVLNIPDDKATVP